MRSRKSWKNLVEKVRFLRHLDSQHLLVGDHAERCATRCEQHREGCGSDWAWPEPRVKGGGAGRAAWEPGSGLEELSITRWSSWVLVQVFHLIATSPGKLYLGFGNRSWRTSIFVISNDPLNERAGRRLLKLTRSVKNYERSMAQMENKPSFFGLRIIENKLPLDHKHHKGRD